MRGEKIQYHYVDHHRPASETPFMAFCWLADDGPTLNAGFAAL